MSPTPAGIEWKELAQLLMQVVLREAFAGGESRVLRGMPGLRFDDH